MSLLGADPVCFILTADRTRAKPFYAGALGLVEVPKPAALAGRGGCWFRAYDVHADVSAEIHVGVEEPFIPARKAHPALVLDDVAALDDLAAHLRAAGHPVDETERTTFPGHLRLHTADPHGNRVEVLSPSAPG